MIPPELDSMGSLIKTGYGLGVGWTVGGFDGWRGCLLLVGRYDGGFGRDEFGFSGWHPQDVIGVSDGDDLPVNGQFGDEQEAPGIVVAFLGDDDIDGFDGVGGGEFEDFSEALGDGSGLLG